VSFETYEVSIGTVPTRLPELVRNSKQAQAQPAKFYCKIS
jgi:hypothetical protein